MAAFLKLMKKVARGIPYYPRQPHWNGNLLFSPIWEKRRRELPFYYFLLV